MINTICKVCGARMIEDEMFASGTVKMVFGNIKDVNEETRLVCPNGCTSEYVKRDI